MWFLVPDNERRTHLEDLHDSRSRYFHNDQCVMSLFPRAAFTKCHKPGLWFKQQLFILLQRRGWKSKNQVLAGLVSSEGREKESVSCFLPASGGLPTIVGIPRLVGTSPSSVSSSSRAISLSVSVSKFLSFFFLIKDTSHLGLGCTLLHYDFILTNHI